jgi:hypothetical protein
MKVSSSKNNFQFSDNEYGYIGLSANQTTGLADTNPVKFNTLSAGNITFDPATYRVTLKKNRTYKLNCYISARFSGATGILVYRLYDVTNGVAIGKAGVTDPLTQTVHYGYVPMCNGIITPTTDITVEVRISEPTNLTGINYLYSSWEIQQINIVSPVIQDPIRQVAYTSPLVNLTVTSTLGGAGFAVIKATGYFYKLNNGTWKLNANITTSQTATTNRSIDIAGVVFEATTNNYQGVTAGGNVASAGSISAYVNPDSSTVVFMSTSSYAYVMASLDCVLKQKPTGFAQIPTDI